MLVWAMTMGSTAAGRCRGGQHRRHRRHCRHRIHPHGHRYASRDPATAARSGNISSWTSGVCSWAAATTTAGSLIRYSAPELAVTSGRARRTLAQGFPEGDEGHEFGGGQRGCCPRRVSQTQSRPGRDCAGRRPGRFGGLRQGRGGARSGPAHRLLRRPRVGSSQYRTMPMAMNSMAAVPMAWPAVAVVRKVRAPPVWPRSRPALTIHRPSWCWR